MKRNAFRWAVVLVIGCGIVGHHPKLLPAHPLHTTLTELSVQRSGQVRLMVRVFEDDFQRAVVRRAVRLHRAGKPDPEPVLHYLQDRLVVRGAGGAVPLQGCGFRRTDNLLWMCMQGPAPGGIGGGSLRNELLFDLYDDQVNIVQVKQGSAPQTMLFTSGDGTQRLP